MKSKSKEMEEELERKTKYINLCADSAECHKKKIAEQETLIKDKDKLIKLNLEDFANLEKNHEEEIKKIRIEMDAKVNAKQAEIQKLMDVATMAEKKIQRLMDGVRTAKEQIHKLMDAAKAAQQLHEVEKSNLEMELTQATTAVQTNQAMIQSLLDARMMTQIAGFIASHVVDVPSQFHRIIELNKYDFQVAGRHLFSLISGLHAERTIFPLQSMHFPYGVRLVVLNGYEFIETRVENWTTPLCNFGFVRVTEECVAAALEINNTKVLMILYHECSFSEMSRKLQPELVPMVYSYVASKQSFPAKARVIEKKSTSSLHLQRKL